MRKDRSTDDSVQCRGRRYRGFTAPYLKARCFTDSVVTAAVGFRIPRLSLEDEHPCHRVGTSGRVLRILGAIGYVGSGVLELAVYFVSPHWPLQSEDERTDMLR